MNPVLFHEEQRFDQVWLRLVMIGSWLFTTAIFTWGIIQQIVLHKPWGNHPGSDTSLIFFSAAIILLMTMLNVFFFRIRLITEVGEEGFHYRFPPFIRKRKTITAAEIAEYRVRKYNPIGEYGGWGFRQSMGKGVAYNTSGNMGLQIILKNGKKILFGTHRPEALQYAMDRMMKPKNF